MLDIVYKKHFASDNNSAVLPEVMEAICSINQGHFASYGADPISDKAYEEVRRVFGKCDPYFVFNGTAANVLALSLLCKSYQSVICAETSHLHDSECGAPEKFLGAKLQLCPTKDGKIDVEKIEKKMIRLGDQHTSQPKVVSITQPTEYGTTYSLQEIEEIYQFCKKNNLYFHLDGSRLVNAAYYLKVEPQEITKYFDVVSLGGTKNGLMGAEAVLVYNSQIKSDFKYLRKQAMQLAGKMRYLSIQFYSWLKDDLYKSYTKSSCDMAQYLAEGLTKKKNIEITQKVESNAVFAILPKEVVKRVRDQYFFYVWDEHTWECRLMTSFDTTKEDVDKFLDLI